MKLIKNIIARFLAFWALFVFASTMMVFIWFYFICFLLSDPYKTRWHRVVSRLWMGIFLFLSGCTFKVTGKEVFDGLENAIIVCNHNSLIDIPVSFPFLLTNSVILFKVATRTLKNSSKLLEKMPKNRNLSNNGTESSAASCKTLALKVNQLFSLSIYLYLCTLFILNF